MCGIDGEVVVYTEAGHVFSRCVTTHSPLKNAELNVSKGGGGPQGAPDRRKRRSLSAGKQHPWPHTSRVGQACMCGRVTAQVGQKR